MEETYHRRIGKRRSRDLFRDAARPAHGVSIGVPDEAQDEHDSYVFDVYESLVSGASHQDTVPCLYGEERLSMGTLRSIDVSP